MREVQFTIPNNLASYGELIRTARDAERIAQREKHNLHLVQWAIQKANVEPWRGNCTIHIHWVEPNSHRKHFDVSAGAVFIERGLVGAGVLAGGRINAIYNTFAVNADNPRIVVTIRNI